MSSSPHPFRYSIEPHSRRHGPAGYRDYRDYQPWLEDDFGFRCVYCLKRQVWFPSDIWSADHVEPQAEAQHRICDYDNLVLSCQWCNLRKSNRRVADPCLVAYGKCVEVDSVSGEIRSVGNSDEHKEYGEELIRVLKLNHPKQVQMRRNKMRELQIIKTADPDEWKRMMGLPQELHDLKRRTPPEGNKREAGLGESWFERRERGELPEIVE